MNIVKDVNNGIVVNKLFQKYLKIKTQKEFDDLKAEIKAIRFGTYKNITVRQYIDQADKGDANDVVRNDFVREMTETKRHEDLRNRIGKLLNEGTSI